ncbi:MAG: coproporphyrinogen-III oxidase family protein, partial [Victivallaceae bacterium]
MFNVQKTDRAEILENAQPFMEQYRMLKEAGFINQSGDFFPSVHYPPITMYQSISQEELFQSYRMPSDELFDIYAHIPFCQQRCIFCHYPVKLGDHYELEKDHYLSALEKEMDIYMGVLGLDKIKARSILIGGGTPTYLSAAQLRRFLDFFV